MENIGKENMRMTGWEREKEGSNQRTEENGEERCSDETM
jgi:hypothetical protein